MTDEELLEQYEPVLRFAHSERFFPMDATRYLERCVLFPSGPQGVLELVTHLDKPLTERIGKLKSGQFFLRYVNDPLADADAWVWWGALSLIGLAAGWLFDGLTGVGIAFGLAALAAVVVFLSASPIRLRFVPAALAALIFIVLEILPVWFFLKTYDGLSIAVEYAVLLPVYLLALFYLSVRTMKFIFDHIIPEAPGVVMDMLSLATEKIAREAYQQYARALAEDSSPVYYGRVVRETDAEGRRWTILQYHYFYAFNDWRLAANGINHHEGDWELIAVYLRDETPYAMLLSQHGVGALELWEDVRRAADKKGQATMHPVVYVALGSHANYSRPEVIRSPALYKPGLLQRLLYWLDGLIHYIFLLINPSQKARQIALKELAHSGNVLAGDAFIHLRDEADHYVVSLPMEIATGDGLRVGCQGDNPREGVLKSSSYLKRDKSDRPVTRPSVREWRRVMLDPEPEWVQYKGLWGVKSPLGDESGPPGPKWDRPLEHQPTRPRKRWARPLEWLAELEALKNHKA
ncbi:MAG: hypothetical protein ACOYZ8_17905 [Chloroflexota bacterium]